VSGSKSVSSESRFKRSGGVSLSPSYTSDWCVSKLRHLAIQQMVTVMAAVAAMLTAMATATAAVAAMVTAMATAMVVATTAQQSTKRRWQWCHR
jgi:hypothetical protein